MDFTTKTGKIAMALLAMQRHSWEQGTAMQAFWEMGEKDIVTAMAYESVYRAMPDGRTATIGVADGVTDPCATGEALEGAAAYTGDPVLRQGADALRTWILEKAPRNSQGLVYHLTGSHAFWADSIYMLPPYLAAIGEWNRAMESLNGYWDVLFDKEAGLLCHMWDEDAGAFTDPHHWGTGNGWALAALARMIPQAPAGDREVLIRRACALLDAVLSRMEPDGSFHDILDDKASFREVNLSQMTAYTIYRGMAEGWLEREYEGAADTMRRCAGEATDSWGIVHHVCGAPAFDRPGQSPEAQAFALLMENAAARWERQISGSSDEIGKS